MSSGADWATKDIWQGIHDAMVRAGVDVVDYNLSGRLSASGSWLRWCYKHFADKSKVKEPTGIDAIYHASLGMLERALRHRADWVLCVASGYVHPDVIHMLRRAGQKVAFLLTESPNDDVPQLGCARVSNVCWVNERTSVAKFRETNPHTYYYQQAMDPQRHFPADVCEIEADVPAHDVVFVGTGWEERIQLLQAVNWDGIDFGLYGFWEFLGSRNKLRKHLRGKVIDNAVTTALYRKAKISLNLHRTSIGYGIGVEHIEHAESLNPRCYELAGCGLFFATDYRAEYDEVFHGAVPIFSNAGELEEVIRYYLAHDEERQTIAAQLPRLVAGHTFDDRVAGMIRVLEEYK